MKKFFIILIILCYTNTAYSQVGIKSGIGLFSGIALAPASGIEVNYKAINLSIMYANSDWKYIPYIYKYDPVFSEGTVHTFDLSSRLLYSVTKSVSIYAGGGLVINTVFSVDSSIFPYLGSGVRLNVLRSFFFDISGGVYFNGMELNLNSEGTAGTSFDTGSPYMIGLAVGIKIK